MKYNLSLIYGSVRSGRKGIRVANYLHQKIKERGIEVFFIDPLNYPLPFLDKMYKEYGKGKAPVMIEELADKFRQSDGLVVLTGEYNHSIPPALLNILDHFQREFYFKPSGIACYSAGPYGGVRTAVHLRAVLAELGMPSISSIQPLPKIGENFDEDGNPSPNISERSVN